MGPRKSSDFPSQGMSAFWTLNPFSPSSERTAPSIIAAPFRPVWEGA